MKTFVLALVLIGAMVAPSLALADLVQNGSFEGAFGTTPYAGSDIPANWMLAPSSDGGSFWVGALGSGTFDEGVAAEDGGSYVAFGATGPAPDSISQTLATLPGVSYDLSFWIDTDLAGGTPLEFTASWGADEVLDLTAPLPLPASGWNEYIFPVAGTGGDTLTFSGYDADGYTLLDNVQVQPLAAPDGSPGLILTASVLLALIMASKRLRAYGWGSSQTSW